MSLTSANRLGPYEIVGLLGTGGMGEVYRARDTRLAREVAIKVLPAAAREDREARERFHREALALSRLNHPNIEMVLDLGQHDAFDYIVLELVPGESLATRIARGRVPEREAAEIGVQVAEALAEAHDRGVLHRDLKPANIMLTPKGRAKVVDFGLAKFAALSESDETHTMGLTRVGTTTGTPAYMAPEQLLGQPVDRRSDLYSLGVVLYELTTGQRPFRATMLIALTNEVLHGQLVPPRRHEPKLSRRVEGVILRAMEREPARRFQTASEMAGELQRLTATHPSKSTASEKATAVPARQPFFSGRRLKSFAHVRGGRVAIWIGIGMLILGLGLGFARGWRFPPPRDEYERLIERKFRQSSSAAQDLGSVISGVLPCGDGRGRFREYTYGVIIVTPDKRVFVVHGYIFGRWRELGAETGKLGYPTSDEMPYVGRGRVSHFEHGQIYWLPRETTAHEVLD